MFTPRWQDFQQGLKRKFFAQYVESMDTRQDTQQDKLQNKRQKHLQEAEKGFTKGLQARGLREASRTLQGQFREKLKKSDVCMLPTYRDALPSGSETGTFLTLDVGGSSFRVAWVKLCGKRDGKTSTGEIVKRWDYPIDEFARALVGRAFFDWIAEKVSTALSDPGADSPRHQDVICLGLAWSFPVEQISLKDALLLQMGKGFHATDGLIGENIRDVIEQACQRKGVNARLSAVVNDSAAGLLSQLYVEQSTSMALILGTGLNVALPLPCSALSPEKCGISADSSPLQLPASDVLVNTEVSMFGKHILPTTVWDELLNSAHERPDYQPLEHFTSGRYLGEIVRLVLLQEIQERRLFNGQMPARFGPYQLQTSTIAAIEEDVSPSLSNAALLLAIEHPLLSIQDYTYEDLAYIRRVITLVSDRAAAYMASTIHALWELQNTLYSSNTSTTSENSCVEEAIEPPAVVSCVGSVICKYPNFRARVQMWLDMLTAKEEEDTVTFASVVRSPSQQSKIRVDLSGEIEATLMGAAVAVALSDAPVPHAWNSAKL